MSIFARTAYHYRLGKGSFQSMNMAKSFRGGIHPLHSIGHGKGLTAEKVIETMPAPERVYIPMSQHIGAPCAPCVSVGDEVKRGHKVALFDITAENAKGGGAVFRFILTTEEASNDQQ